MTAMMFSGLRSVWIRWHSVCKKSRPWSICLMICCTKKVGIPVFRFISSHDCNQCNNERRVSPSGSIIILEEDEKERNISKEEKSIKGCGEREVNKGIIKRKWKEGKTPSPPPLEMARVIKAVHGNRKLNYVQKESPLTKHANNL